MSSVLNELINHEKDLSGLGRDFAAGFARFRATLRIWGNPQRALSAGHVVGSKGKGSVACLIAGLLRGMISGPVGLYTSPHFRSPRERIRLDGRMIPRQDLERLASRVIRRNPGLTWFECLTLCAYLYFREEKTAFAVYEAGLGGRLDATNALSPSFVVVTPIEREHEEILGPGLAAIAAEKLAVIKPGVPVFSFRQDRTVLCMLERVCAEKKSRLYLEGRDFSVQILSVGPGGMLFRYRNLLSGESREVKTIMASPVQARNAGLALFLLETQFPDLPVGRLVERLGNLSVPGRFVILRRQPLRLFDPCHTPASFRNFLQGFSALADPQRSDLFIFLLKDKKTRPLLRLARKAGFRRIYWVKVAHPRAEDPVRLAGGIRVLDVRGFRKLWKSSSADSAAAGSFYLAGCIPGGVERGRRNRGEIRSR